MNLHNERRLLLLQHIPFKARDLRLSPAYVKTHNLISRTVCDGAVLPSNLTK